MGNGKNPLLRVCGYSCELRIEIRAEEFQEVQQESPEITIYDFIFPQQRYDHDCQAIWAYSTYAFKVKTTDGKFLKGLP